MGTLDSPSEGNVIVGGTNTEGLSEKEIAMIRSRQFGFIFQMHHLLPQCTAMENVLVPTLALPEKPDAGKVSARAKDLFERVGLSDKMDSRPSQLSGGERQRVAVIRALINRPKLLLADEPTGALDEENAAKLIELLVDLNVSDNLALIVVTHDLEIAESLSSVRTLKQGKLEES